MENSRNLILAVFLCAVLIIGWDLAMNRFYPQPETPVEKTAVETGQEVEAASGDAFADGSSAAATNLVAGEAPDTAETQAPEPTVDRVAIEAPHIAGSINPVGARIDDVVLPAYDEVLDGEEPVRIFSQANTKGAYFAQFGWVGEGVSLPTSSTVWQVDGEKLTPATPVTLRWDNGVGQLFTIALSVDDKYMITAEQTVANTSDGPVVVRPRAGLSRSSEGADPSQFTIHSGPFGYFGEAVEFGPDYDDLIDDGDFAPTERTGWLGFTDIYWMSVLIPERGSDPQSGIRHLGNDNFLAAFAYQPQTIQPGRQVSKTTQLFVGAKDDAVLAAYEDAGVPGFDNAIDWGWFGFLEKPILWLLKQLYSIAGNFGVAIILLTVLVRLLLFPIAQKQFASMAGMKAIQPKMKALQERYKDDKQKQQQEIMALYKKEGVNPLAGCLPILLQIPIFFGLYKVLMISIEMRHKPFALWIDDLSAPDPATFLNLFGYLDFTVPGFLAIGPLAVLLGVTMWLTFKLNPSAMDPMQQQIFNLMPWILMFVMAPFAAGLLLYWVTNNVLTLAQQTYLYSRHPQLKAAAEKEKADKARAAEREKSGSDKPAKGGKPKKGKA